MRKIEKAVGVGRTDVLEEGNLVGTRLISKLGWCRFLSPGTTQVLVINMSALAITTLARFRLLFRH